MTKKIYFMLAFAIMTMQGAWAQGLSGSGTFSRPYEPVQKDAFYSETLGEAQCNPTYSISAASDAYSLAFGEPTVTYDVSGIGAYNKEFEQYFEGQTEPSTYTASHILKYDGACYALAGQEISFAIDGAGINNCSIAGDGGLLITPD